MLVDANLLLFAVDSSSSFHRPAKRWLTDQLNGARRLGLPWQTLAAFLRIATNPRATRRPLGPAEAWGLVQDWLGSEVAWIPTETAGHAEILGRLIRRYELRSNLIADARLAALAIEHGLTVASADTDFARFKEVRWVNPLD